MRYAIISDIHSNYPALKAVLTDIGPHGADAYIFVGDYVLDYSYPNEVVDTIRALNSAHVISGNKEGFMRMLLKQGQDTWTVDQFTGVYWNIRRLTEENIDYLSRLPEELQIRTPDRSQMIVATHLSDEWFDSKPLNCRYYKGWRERKPFTHDAYLAYAQSVLLNDQMFIERLDSLPPGLLIFGDTHVQWHARVGDKIIVNPGSCGQPLDYDVKAAYTLADYQDGVWSISERRVAYDIEETINHAVQTGLYREAEIWCDLIFDGLRTGGDYASSFLQLARETARERHEEGPPFQNETWRLTAEKWKAAGN